MIYFPIGHPGTGNLGNSLFQLASTLGLSYHYNTKPIFSHWKYFSYFQNPPETKNIHSCFPIPEKTYKFDWTQWDDTKEIMELLGYDLHKGTAKIVGWLQDSRYWEHCKEEVLKTLEIKPEYTAWIKAKYSRAFTKPTIAISVRRGDYVNNPNYELLPIRYYIGALLTHFPDFRDNYNILILSDDVEYCKLHFKCLSNAFYAEGDAIEQHTLGRQADHFIISNSTFAYWVAYLGKNPTKKVITPKYLFAGRLLETEGNVNFWSNEGWTEFDHKNFKIDLSDTTFTIPCFHDSEDRDENLTLTTKLLKEDFSCKIIVGENQTSSFSHLGDKYIKFNYPEFHRTRMLNQMAHKANTPIVVNWDADVNVPPLQLLEAVRLIRSGYDMVYPYDGRFARVPRTHYQEVNQFRDVGILSPHRFKGTRIKDERSVGGAIAFNKESFINGGMENENFRSYGPEDRERFYRFNTLGFKIEKIAGTLYHIDHKITLNSSMQQPNYEANHKEWEKVSQMDKNQLQDYVETWDFNSNYPATYYNEIKDTTSAKEVFDVLETWIDFKSVVDVGCGSMGWCTDRHEYTGLDFNLADCRIPRSCKGFANVDIRKPLPALGKYDLALCLEVAEHVDELYVDTVVSNLATLSDQILFSAAIPGQDGENHINCQWQSYWAKKFEYYGFYPFFQDIRTPLWNNPNVAPWYRQNMVLYTNSQPTREYELDKIHPEMYLNLLK